MQSIVKKWFKDKNFGFLENGSGPDIMVRQADLIKCQYLKVGTLVEFECHPDKKGLVAKKVKIANQSNSTGRQKNNNTVKEPYFGVMT